MQKEFKEIEMRLQFLESERVGHATGNSFLGGPGSVLDQIKCKEEECLEVSVIYKFDYL